MRRIGLLLIGFLAIALPAGASELSKASSQDLLAVYKQLRSIQGTDKAAIAENVVFKRDAATFTFLTGRIAFAAPVAGRVLAAKFQGEGKVEFEPPSDVDQRQLARFTKKPKLEDTFREAVFYFTDDTYEELSKLVKIRQVPDADLGIFASSQKQYSENYNGWVDNARKFYPTMRNMAARMLSDLTDESSKGFFLADFKGVKSGDLLLQISWNRDSLLYPGINKGEEVMLLHMVRGEFTEWWSGFHLAPEYAQSPHPDHRALLAHSASTLMDLTIAKDNTISATVQMEYTVDGAVRVLPFNLNGVLRISSVEDGSGNKVSFIQEDRKLDNDPWLILPEISKPGEKYKVKVTYKEDSTYESRLVYDQGSGLFLIASGDNWYPSFGAFDDRTQFEIRVRAPKRFKVVASGVQGTIDKDKDDVITAFKTEIPVASIAFNYGDMVESSQALQDIKMTAYAGREIPNDLRSIVGGFQAGSIMMDGRMDSNLMKGGFTTAGSVKTAVGAGLQAFKFGQYLYGDLAFKSLSVVQLPTRIGEGNNSSNLIFLPYSYFLDSTTQNSLGLQLAAEQREFLRIGAIKQMANQWLDHMVGAKTYHDRWLTSGSSDFASLMYLRQFEPKEVGTFRDIRRKWLLSKNAHGYRPVDAGPVWLNPQINEYNEKTTNLLVIPYKGGYIYEMLRVLLYDPKLKNPDGRFLAMLHDFVTTYSGQNASTEDFRKVVEKHAQRSMDWFFNEWVYGSDTPNYDFSYQLNDAGGGQTEAAITLTQSNVPETFKMQLPLYMVVNGEQKYLGLIGVQGTKPLKTSVKLPMRPDKILLDPDRNILAEIHQ
jgi:hypothetical protein